MKKYFILTIIVMFAVACGKSGGSSGAAAPTTPPGAYNPGTPGAANEAFVEFAAPLSLCGQGALNVQAGTRMSMSAARVYFYDYLMNADKMRRDLGYLKTTRYDSYSGQPREVYMGTVNGIEIAEWNGSTHGYP